MGKKKGHPLNPTYTPRATPVRLDIALVEYVRCGYKPNTAEKVSGVHHNTIVKHWDKLSDAEKETYKARAATICEEVEKRVIDNEVAIISETTSKLKEIGTLALDELKARLGDEFRRTEMKDADLINIATKCLAMVDENTRLKEEEEKKKPSNITNVFNILDQSIQEHLHLKSLDYEKQ